MQKLIFIITILSSICCLSFRPIVTERGALILEVENIELDTGTIWVGIYDSESNFMVKERAIVEGFKVGTTTQITCQIPELTYGSYAIAIFHDQNENGELDTNLLGIPKEPYGFSGTVKSKWRLPRFNEVKFNFKNPDQIVKILLERW